MFDYAINRVLRWRPSQGSTDL